MKNWCFFKSHSINEFKSFFIQWFIENYWNIHSSKSLFVIIQRIITLVRFQQIKRFFKMSNFNNESDFYDFDWWKKLKSLTSDFQKISQKLYMSSSHVSVNEQLILFKERFKHILKMIAKKIDEDFKIYNLCEKNYLLAFLFASKVSWTKNWAYRIVRNIDFWWYKRWFDNISDLHFILINIETWTNIFSHFYKNISLFRSDHHQNWKKHS